MTDFSEYLRQSGLEKWEKGYAWQTAIGWPNPFRIPD